MRTTDSPGLCATLSPTGATAGGTRHSRSPSPRTSDDGGDGRAPSAQAMGVGGGTGENDAGRPPSGAGPPDPHPPAVQCGGGARATSSGREDGGTERERGPTAPQPANR